MKDRESVVMAEQSLLGAVLQDPTTLAAVGDRVSPADFDDLRHRLIFKTAADLHSSGVAVDVVAVLSRLEATSAIGKAGGPEYVFDLADSLYGRGLTDRYAGIVTGAAQIRRARKALLRGLATLEDADPVAPSDAIGRASAGIVGLLASEPDSGSVGLGAAVSAFARTALENARAREAGEDVQIGLTTTLQAVNRPTVNGLVPGECYAIGARPKAGKTAFAFHLAVGAAMRNGVHALYCSWEDQPRYLAGRFAAAQAGRTGPALHGGQFDSGLAGKMIQLRDESSHLDGLVTIVHKPGRGVELIEQEITRHRRREAEGATPLGVVVVDHVGRLIRDENRAESELRRVVKALEEMAKRHHVVILILTQLNRASVAQGKVRAPGMGDIRGSEALEECCAGVMLIHRPGASDLSYRRPQEAWLIWTMSRHGRIGRQPMHWMDEIGVYRDADEPWGDDAFKPAPSAWGNV